jgi:hypothetical protein
VNMPPHERAHDKECDGVVHGYDDCEVFYFVLLRLHFRRQRGLYRVHVARFLVGDFPGLCVDVDVAILRVLVSALFDVLLESSCVLDRGALRSEHLALDEALVQRLEAAVNKGVERVWFLAPADNVLEEVRFVDQRSDDDGLAHRAEGLVVEVLRVVDGAVDLIQQALHCGEGHRTKVASHGLMVAVPGQQQAALPVLVPEEPTRVPVDDVGVLPLEEHVQLVLPASLLGVLVCQQVDVNVGRQFGMLHRAHMQQPAPVTVPWVEKVIEASETVKQRLDAIRHKAASDPELLLLLEQLAADNESNRAFAVAQACLHFSEIVQDLTPEEISKIEEWNTSLPLY